MARAIDADALWKEVEPYGLHKGCVLGKHGGLADILMDIIEKQPTIDPVKHGHWEEFDCEYGGISTKGYVCSECGRTEANKEPYCHCGARMDGE